MKFSYASGSKPLDGYTIKRGVGIGGFGEVYFALSDAGKEVALKRVQRNLDIELRGVGHCLNLKHTNLVDLYDIRYDEQGGAWVVMEFITGESLKDVIDRNPNGMPPEEAQHWITGMLLGVAYLHDQGIVHRDLKPGNIFNDQGTIKIGDYGLAKFISGSRRSGQTESVGTFHYMAPEIGKGSYGKEIDVYALGVILYEMLTGKVPFDGESSQEIIMRHLTEDADVSMLSSPYRQVVATALTKDPELRYSNVSDMLADLQDSGRRVGSVPVEAIPVAGVPAAAARRAPVNRDDVIYIDDEPPPREMQFGPVKTHKPSVQAIAPTPARRLAEPAAVARSPYGPARAAVPVAPLAGEPIARAATQAFRRVADWWRGSGLNTGLKVLIVVALLAVIIFNAQWLIPLGMAVAAIYAIYAGIFLMVQALSAGPTESLSGIQFRTWQELVRENMRAKPLGVRLGELSGSWLGAAVIASLVSLVMVAAADKFDTNVDSLLQYAWLAVSATLGAWGVLAVGKFAEGSDSDAFRRRLIMLALGLVVGAAAFGLEHLLLVNLHIARASLETSWTTMVAVDGSLRLPLFLVFFAGLFVVPGWWKQTDPLRRTRFNLISLGACVLWSYLLSLVWPFPQPWGFMLAATISLTAQLAAPWMTAKEREAARREFRRV
jgi:hypothetical protein